MTVLDSLSGFSHSEAFDMTLNVGSNTEQKIALITGASRGIGAGVARQLAQRGLNLVINYRKAKTRAQTVAEDVAAVGREALLCEADITDRDSVARMVELTRQHFGRLDALVLNASGGLEKDRGDNYAMDLNLHAQASVVDLCLPIMPRGSRLVFVTSHQAHFFGVKPVYSGYQKIAESKHAGEAALRARTLEFCGLGISMVVVSGDMIDGTITPMLLERASPGLVEDRRREAGFLPDVEEFSSVIADAAVNKGYRSGGTIYVGSTDWVAR